MTLDARSLNCSPLIFAPHTAGILNARFTSSWDIAASISFRIVGTSTSPKNGPSLADTSLSKPPAVKLVCRFLPVGSASPHPPLEVFIDA
jgi:hypothetical protein